MKPITIFAIIVVVLIILALFSKQREIATFIGDSSDAQARLETMTSPKVVGYVTPQDTDMIFMVISENGASTPTYHVFYKASKNASQAQYVGQLQSIFGVDWFLVLPIRVGENELFIGKTTVAKATSAVVERPNGTPSKWMCDQFESTTDNGVFLMPFSKNPNITNGNGCYLGSWSSISKIAVQTKASLQRGFDQTGSYYEQERDFSPAIDIQYVTVQ